MLACADFLYVTGHCPGSGGAVRKTKALLDCKSVFYFLNQRNIGFEFVAQICASVGMLLPELSKAQIPCGQLHIVPR